MLQLSIYPAELNTRLRSTIGDYDVLTNYRPRSSRTGVWKVHAKREDRNYFLKTYTRKQRWHPEVYAYQNWMLHLQPYVPELIDIYEGEEYQAILIGSIEGTIMRETVLDDEQVYRAYSMAGQLTQQIHTLATGEWFGRPDKDGAPIELNCYHDPVTYIRSSIEETYTHCITNHSLDQDEIQLVEWALENATVFKDSKPVPVSWDSTPGNWLVDAKGDFAGMIDFENMLWGIDVESFSILFERYFNESEMAKRAFFEGYGNKILAEKYIHIRITCIKLALGNIWWGTVNDSPRVIEYGRQLIKQMRDWKDGYP